MSEGKRKNWRELCHAALEAKDPDELMEILQELNKALKVEEQVRRDFREAARTNTSAASEANNSREIDHTSAYFQRERADATERHKSPVH